MKKYLLILSTIALIFGIYSCSDNSTNPSAPNYFPLNLGNYWIYEQFLLDSLNTKVSGSMISDSVFVSGSQIENVLTNTSVTTYKMKHNYSDNSSNEQKNYSNESGIYQYFDQIPGLPSNLFGLKLSDYMQISWVKMIDLKNPTWVILSGDTLTIPEITLQGQRVSVSLIISMTGAKGTTKSFTVNSQTVNTQEYLLNFNVSGVITLLDLMGFKVPISAFSIPTHVYLADGIGIVSSKTESVHIGVANVINQTLPGSESTLLRYYISK